ncbi:hypothetical protein Q7C36_004125 [Tachysurus vachellii]|uniref:Uncharacterized protein n=1 Tax=Tachysurus vachellii TaxID=175792 RepID=A0AA88NJM4_TACVA|nr:hypothetical protein Q7C36_004125 [Tachysurus vachellii]
MGPTRAPPPGPALLVPEFCYLTGLTDNMRNDFTIMRDLATHTRLSPEQRENRLNRFVSKISKNASAQDALGRWGLSFENKMLNLTGRVLPAERIIHGARAYEYNPWVADWSKEMRGPLINAIPLGNWPMFFTRRNADIAHSRMQALNKVSGPMGIQMQRSGM